MQVGSQQQGGFGWAACWPRSATLLLLPLLLLLLLGSPAAAPAAAAGSCAAGARQQAINVLPPALVHWLHRIIPAGGVA